MCRTCNLDLILKSLETPQLEYRSAHVINELPEPSAWTAWIIEQPIAKHPLHCFLKSLPDRHLLDMMLPVQENEKHFAWTPQDVAGVFFWAMLVNLNHKSASPADLFTRTHLLSVSLWAPTMLQCPVCLLNGNFFFQIRHHHGHLSSYAFWVLSKQTMSAFGFLALQHFQLSVCGLTHATCGTFALRMTLKVSLEDPSTPTWSWSSCIQWVWHGYLLLIRRCPYQYKRTLQAVLTTCL